MSFNLERLVELVKSNEAPSDSECHQIQRLLDLTKARLENTATKSDVSRLNDFKVILHPIRRLSVDTLGEIFSQCQEEVDYTAWNRNYTGFGDSTLNLGYWPWALTQVSRSWRQAAILQRKLWSSIRVDTASPNSSELLVKQLQWSGGAPLTVSFNGANIPSSAFRTLAMLSHRWKSLSIHIDRASFTNLVFIDNLATLSILHLDDMKLTPALSIPPALQGLFEYAPQLTKLSGSPDLLAPFQLPWKQIIEYRVLGVQDGRHLATIIRRMQNLVFLGLHEIIRQPESITLASLQELSLHDNRDFGLGGVLTSLTTPQLDMLHIDEMVSRSAFALGSFLARTPSIRRIYLSSCHVKEDEIIRAVRQAPFLESLTIMGPNIAGILELIATVKSLRYLCLLWVFRAQYQIFCQKWLYSAFPASLKIHSEMVSEESLKFWPEQIRGVPLATLLRSLPQIP
ncbi:hypothetical protein C8J56DRAFT_970320 [Mycena floridula]|nr:hypothetical protein C8J56DRAFT_970320 [Mycena floridula]